MSSVDTKSNMSLGFLTVIHNPQYGLFGGYLILNATGRPLEFHCTAPIKPNRAQEILYGPTLEAFLYGEQIGQTLIRQSSAEPILICTDSQPALAVREYVSLPVVLVLPPEQSIGIEPDNRFFRIDQPHGSEPDLRAFQLGRNRLALPAKAQQQRLVIEQQLHEVAESFDLAEPFERIRQAIQEAQQAVR